MSQFLAITRCSTYTWSCTERQHFDFKKKQQASWSLTLWGSKLEVPWSQSGWKLTRVSVPHKYTHNTYKQGWWALTSRWQNLQWLTLCTLWMRLQGQNSCLGLELWPNWGYHIFDTRACVHGYTQSSTKFEKMQSNHLHHGPRHSQYWNTVYKMYFSSRAPIKIRALNTERCHN